MNLILDKIALPAHSAHLVRPRLLSLLHASLGWRDEKWDFSLWVRNLTNEHYLQNVTVQAGNSGLVVGTPADPRSFGATLRASF